MPSSTHIRSFPSEILQLRPLTPNGRPALLSLNSLEFDLMGNTQEFSSFGQCIRLLGNAPNVHSLTVRSMSGSTAAPAQLLRFDNLRNLRVIAAAGQLGTIGKFLDRILCPSLKQLVVQTVNDEGSDETVPRFILDIRDFLQRSKCTLEILKIQSRLIPEECIIQLLFRTPDLRSLVLSDCGDLSESIFSTLSAQCPGDRWCLDKLRKIVFDRCTFASEDGYGDEEFVDDMIEMIWSRLSSGVSPGPGKGLEVVVSECGIEFDIDMLEQLKLMEEQGLKLGTEHRAMVTEFDDVDEV